MLGIDNIPIIIFEDGAALPYLPIDSETVQDELSFRGNLFLLLKQKSYLFPSKIVFLSTPWFC